MKIQNTQLSLNFRKTTHNFSIVCPTYCMGHIFTEKLFITYLRFTCFMWQPKEGTSQTRAASVYFCMSHHVCMSQSRLPQTTLRKSVKSVNLGGSCLQYTHSCRVSFSWIWANLWYWIQCKWFCACSESKPSEALAFFAFDLLGGPKLSPRCWRDYMERERRLETTSGGKKRKESSQQQQEPRPNVWSQWSHSSQAPAIEPSLIKSQTWEWRSHLWHSSPEDIRHIQFQCALSKL